MSIFDTLQDWGSEASDTVKSWSWMEGSDEKPKTTVQQSNSEKLAEGSSLPQVDNAQNNTGVAVSPTGYLLNTNSTILIGGGVMLVVLFFALMMIRGGR